MTLHARTAGSVTAPTLVLIHPNPMDSSCWLFQLAHLSTWYRCVAVDLPGYGFSPPAAGHLSLPAVADLCWEVADRVARTSAVVLVGCSVGSSVAQHMYHRRPEAVSALVLCGTGYRPVKTFARRRADGFRREGLGYRRLYARDCFSAEFGRTPLAEWLLQMLSERDRHADLTSILALFAAMEVPDPDWLQRDVHVPVLIVSGSEDRSHDSAFDLRDRLPEAAFVTLEGAGHACFLEQPWHFDDAVVRFLRAHALHPG